MSKRLHLGHVIIASVLLLGSGGCLKWQWGIHFEDVNRFSQRPGRSYRADPIARVDETLYGFNLFGFTVKGVQPEKLREEYLARDPDYRVTNWQVSASTLDIPYLDFLFTIPYSRVLFDIVEVEEIHAN